MVVVSCEKAYDLIPDLRTENTVHRATVIATSHNTVATIWMHPVIFGSRLGVMMLYQKVHVLSLLEGKNSS